MYVSDKFNMADKDLKTKIDDVENQLKEDKVSEIKAFFEEYRISVSILVLMDLSFLREMVELLMQNYGMFQSLFLWIFRSYSRKGGKNKS